MLDALEGHGKLDLFKSAASHMYHQILMRNQCSIDAKQSKIENMLCILKHIRDDELVKPLDEAPFRFHKGMLLLLNTVFNDTTNWHFHTALHTEEAPNVFDKMRAFIQKWQQLFTDNKPTAVIFNGFSLGAMMTTVLAPCVHANFVLNKVTPPTIECRTLCGMKMGDEALSLYVSQYTPCVNCISEHDPVSCLPTKSEYSHVFPIVTVRVHDSSARFLQEDNKLEYQAYLKSAMKIFYRETPYLNGLLNSKTDSVIGMCINYLMKKSDNFRRYHLSAEDVMPRLMLNYCVEILKEVPSAYFDFVGTSNPELLCSYFSTNNYAMKYGICPPSKCMFTHKDEQRMKWTCAVRK